MPDVNDMKTRVMAAIAAKDPVKGVLIDHVRQLDEDRDNLINTTFAGNGADIEGKISDDYMSQHFSDYDAYILAGHTKRQYVEEKLSLSRKLEILSIHIGKEDLEYGSDTFTDDLGKRQVAKEERKKRYAQDAKKLIDGYNKLLEENREIISTIKADIDRRKQLVAEDERALTTLMAKDDETAIMQNGKTAAVAKAGNLTEKIENLKKKISVAKSDITKKEKELSVAKEAQSSLESEIDARIDEIKSAFEYKNIFIDSDGNVTKDLDKEGKQGEEQDNATLQPGTDTSMNSLASKYPGEDSKNKAKKMLMDFLDAPPERQREMLDRYGHDDIRHMAENMGILNRPKLKLALEARLDELPQGGVVFRDKDGNRKKISKEKLKSVGSITMEELKAIRYQIDEFNKNFSEKTPEQIERFEAKLKYVQAAVLLRETTFARGVSRYADKMFSAKGKMITDLSKSIGAYSDKKHARVKYAREKEDAWRSTLKFKPKPRDLTRLSLDRSGREAIDRHGEDRDGEVLG